jgi:hypothetical protein
VNALAAARLYGAPAVVLDFGTATTVDAIAADGAFVGGAIAPGLELGLEALAERTARLPRVELRTPERAIGRDTVSAIQAGTILGYQALAAGLLARVRRELADASGIAPEGVRAILTGGLSAARWVDALEPVDAIDPDLTLKGLAILYAEVGGGLYGEAGGRRDAEAGGGLYGEAGGRRDAEAGGGRPAEAAAKRPAEPEPAIRLAVGRGPRAGQP